MREPGVGFFHRRGSHQVNQTIIAKSVPPIIQIRAECKLVPPMQIGATRQLTSGVQIGATRQLTSGELQAGTNLATESVPGIGTTRQSSRRFPNWSHPSDQPNWGHPADESANRSHGRIGATRQFTWGEGGRTGATRQLNSGGEREWCHPLVRRRRGVPALGLVFRRQTAAVGAGLASLLADSAAEY
jgi:hypothetical protein